MSNITVALIALGINILVLIVVGLLAYIGKGTHKRIDSLKDSLKEYQTKEICTIYRNDMIKDINGIGKMARGKSG